MISPETIAIVGVAALIIFGPKKLPELGKSLGQGIREFKRGTDGLKSEFEQGLHPDQAAQQQQITTQTAQAVPVAAMTTQATQGQTVYPQVPQTQPQAPQTVPTELVVQAVPQSDHEPLKS